MNPNSKIFVAGHTGLVGSAIVRRLRKLGFTNLTLKSSASLDLTCQQQTLEFFAEAVPEYVFLAAAKVGGILANAELPADFIYKNLMIQSNTIEAAYQVGVERLLFLGSSCIYPRDCPQPIKEKYLLTGPLEPTNRPYAVAKIAGIEQCWSYNRQFGTRYLTVMPTNLFGPGDSYDLETSHVIPALIRKFHEAKESSSSSVTVWGSGKPRREFLYCDDLADACVFLMRLDNTVIDQVFASSGMEIDNMRPPLLNVGCGKDVSISELAALVAETTGFEGDIVYDCNMPDGTPRKLLDVSRIRDLGWEPTVNLRDGLAQTYASYLAQNAGQ